MATTTNLTCPQCGASLRPSRPVPAGKRVKCPKCGNGFVAGAESARQTPAKAKASPVQKKPAAESTPIAPAMPYDDDEEGGGGTYVFRDEGPEDNAPGLDFAEDLSIRDLRGPAMKAVMDPSNKLILVGASGFFGWLAFLVILIIPIVFPVETKEEKEKSKTVQEQLEAMKDPAGAAAARKKRADADSSFLKLGDLDLRKIGDLNFFLAVACFLPIFLGMAYAGVLCMGAVKIQNLESREWGVASSVMAMVPINAGGVLCVLALVLNLVLEMVFEDYFKWVVLGFFLLCAWGTNVAVGIYMLTTLNKPEVIAGFDYVPD